MRAPRQSGSPSLELGDELRSDGASRFIDDGGDVLAEALIDLRSPTGIDATAATNESRCRGPFRCFVRAFDLNERAKRELGDAGVRAGGPIHVEIRETDGDERSGGSCFAGAERLFDGT